MQALRTIYRWWVALLFAAVVVQIGAAGYGAFNASDKVDPGPLTDKVFDDGFDFHNGFGYIIFLGAVILFLLALGGRLGKQHVLRVLGVPILVAVQIVLAWAGEDHPVVGILHPINAFLILGFVGSLAFAAWRKVRAIG
ncbi:MAG TPA: hypothetical protein VIM05_05680 [Gaiellaceae bacterium]